MEGAIHRPLSLVDGAKVVRVHGEMGKWTAQLCVCVPQVRLLHIFLAI